MYIKSIVLDGFKSYGNRTEIQGFDKEFNAITGLNGTGKSNILDSICFVLGITNLTNVRATSLQDLVFKSGQAGITKASVSITFDNHDKSQCPVGYEDYDEFTVTRQVVMGGKNKYLLNGTTVQNKRIQDLFCSVQLNVNNPHFLIMQGRITKVLNMKPPEILSMVEESAGTKMYETKRCFAQKTIEKKEAKVNEMTTLIREAISPKLERLREERREFMEFKRVERELQHMEAKFMAWQYIQAGKMVARAAEQLQEKELEIQEITDKIEHNRKKAEAVDKEIEEIQQRDSETGKRFHELEEVSKEKEKLFAKAKAEAKSANENVQGEEKRLKELIKSKEDDEKTLQEKEKEMQNMDNKFKDLKDAEANDSAALKIAQKKFEALSAGKEIDDQGNASTLQEQLMTARHNLATVSTAVKKATMEIGFKESLLKTRQTELGSSAADYKKDKHNLDNLAKEVKSIEAQLKKYPYDEDQYTKLLQNRKRLEGEIRMLQAKTERFETSYPLIAFPYTDPEPNFNRRSVKGVACRLIKIKDKDTAVALETVAGSKLFNVVVDTETTGKKLLDRGQLPRRRTLLPLNKMRGNPINKQTLELAQSLVGKENVQTALSLIEYNRDLQPAMEFIFGDAFVCTDMNVANKIAYDNRIKRKCVTIEGDTIEPAGTMSGGATKKGVPILLQLDDYNNDAIQLSAKQQEFQKTDVELSNMNKICTTYRNLQSNLDLKTHEYNVVNQRLQQTAHYRQQDEIDQIKALLTELTEDLKINQKEEKIIIAKVKEIENNIKNSKGNKEKKLKDAETELKKLKKQAENSKNLWQQKEQDYETIKLELTELQNAITTGVEQIEKCKEDIIALKETAEQANIHKNESEEVSNKLNVDLKELKTLMNSKNKEIQKRLKVKNTYSAENAELELKIKEQSHSTSELKNKYNDSKHKETSLKKHIKDDNIYLHEVKDISDKEGHALGKKIAVAQDQKNKMARTVNLKAQSMFDAEEKQYKALVKRKVTVEADKKKFMDLVDEIDRKKTEALTLAVKHITKDFGSIFSTLLPGANSKLQPPEGKTVLEGLEIKVSLGGIWKESLSELSGGQKSLIALSLILAMLRYKPAPIYILDEVDAALDLSHTQNIGVMLKKHFKASQFIIVSLKDGMFSNANVLFRTKFVDGMSTVQRTVNTNN